MQEKPMPTYPEAFNHTCNLFPERKAQIFNPELYNGDYNGCLTWRDLKQRVEEIACGLLSIGCDKQERIAIMAQTSPYWTQVDMAISNAGGVSVTIYPTLSINEMKYIVNDSGVKYFFAGNQDILDKVLQVINELPTVEKIFVMDIRYKSTDPRVMGLGELIEIGSEFRRNNYAVYEQRWKNVTLDDWYTILYTSGTTGQGKGVVLTHWAQASRGRGVVTDFAKIGGGMLITEEDITLVYLPLSHIFERVSCQQMAIWDGATMAYADSPATFIDDLQKYNPTWINCVPRLYEKIYITLQQQMASSAVKRFIFNRAVAVGEKTLQYRTDDKGCINMAIDFDLVSKLPPLLKLRYKIADKLVFSKVRALFGNRFKYAFSASAALSPDLIRFFFSCGVAICEGYGATETYCACAVNPITACKPGKVGPICNGSIGRVAKDGELEIAEAGLLKEYLNKPEDTAAVFTEDGWYKTGDLVEIDEDGYVRIVDRKKAIICLAIGKNVAPQKIENLFSTSTYIEQLFVIGDERNYITCLFVPNFNYFVELFDKEGIEYDKSKVITSNDSGIPVIVEVGEDFISQPYLKNLISQNVEAVNQNLEEFERVKNYAILRKRFTEAGGELTPTLKVKKRVVLDKYADIIDSLYKH